MLLLDDDDELPEHPEPREAQLALRVGREGRLAISLAILANATIRWSKVARIVVDTVDAGGFTISDAVVALHARCVVELAALGVLDAQGNLKRPRWSEVRLPVQEVGEEEVVEILRRGHNGPPDKIDGTIARVRGRGPFKRVRLPGSLIGRLKFQPPNHDRQCTLSSFFEDDPARFSDWLVSLDIAACARHQFQIDQFAKLDGKFELPPVFDFEGQLLDGGHRTRAAYYAYLQSQDLTAALEIICDVAQFPA